MFLDSTPEHAISAEALLYRLAERDPPAVLDARRLEEHRGDTGHIPGSRSVPVGELLDAVVALAELRGRPVVTACSNGARAATAAGILAAAGFPDVRFLEGGLIRWSQLGYPLERSPTSLRDFPHPDGLRIPNRISEAD